MLDPDHPRAEPTPEPGIPAKPRDVAWHRARAPDKGSGVTSMVVFIQGSTDEEMRWILGSVDAYNAYDESEATFTQLDTNQWDAVATSMKRAGGPNEAITMAGKRITRSDLEVEV